VRKFNWLGALETVVVYRLQVWIHDLKLAQIIWNGSNAATIGGSSEGFAKGNFENGLPAYGSFFYCITRSCSVLGSLQSCLDKPTMETIYQKENTALNSSDSRTTKHQDTRRYIWSNDHC